MNVFNSANRSKKLLYLFWAGVFGLMLLLNFLTHYYADDYAYMYNFQTGERIQNFFDIFPSIYRHYFIMNGRLTAHFFAQLFLMMPKFVFNIVNALMFLAMLLLIDKLSNREKRVNCLLFALSFCAIWVFQPAFGQVNLWLDGSVNYLWSAVVALLFLVPYASRLEGGLPLSAAWQKALFVLFCFFAGGYSENTSAAIIAVSFLLLLLIRFWKKEKPGAPLILGWFASCAGFLVMALSPAGIDKKVTAFEADVLLQRLDDTVTRISEIKWLLLLWAFLFVAACLFKTKRERLVLSAAYLAAGLFANFILVFSTYYPPRSMCSVTVFVVTAVFTLLWELYGGRRKAVIDFLALAAILASIYPLYIGGKDIWHTYQLCDEAYAVIAECRAEGEMDVSLPYLWSATKYSPANDLKYLDTEDPSTWPNYSMARYFEVNSILGYYE